MSSRPSSVVYNHYVEVGSNQGTGEPIFLPLQQAPGAMFRPSAAVLNGGRNSVALSTVSSIAPASSLARMTTGPPRASAVLPLTTTQAATNTAKRPRDSAALPKPFDPFSADHRGEVLDTTLPPEVLARKSRRLDAAASADQVAKVSVLESENAGLRKDVDELDAELDKQREESTALKVQLAELKTKLGGAEERLSMHAKTLEECSQLKLLVQKCYEEMRQMKSQVDKNEGRMNAILDGKQQQQQQPMQPPATAAAAPISFGATTVKPTTAAVSFGAPAASPADVAQSTQPPPAERRKVVGFADDTNDSAPAPVAAPTSNPFGGSSLSKTAGASPFGASAAATTTAAASPFGAATAATGAAASSFGFGVKPPPVDAAGQSQAAETKKETGRDSGTTSSSAAEPTSIGQASQPTPFGNTASTAAPVVASTPAAANPFSAAAPAAPSSSSSSVFGGSAAAAAPNLGSTTAPTQPPTFGATPAAAPAATSPFGTAAPAAAPSPFGAAAPAAAPSPFGAAAPTAASSPFGSAATSAPTSSPFGAAAATPAVSQPPPAPSPFSAAGGTAQPPVFGGSATAPSPFGSAPSSSSFGGGAAPTPFGASTTSTAGGFGMPSSSAAASPFGGASASSGASNPFTFGGGAGAPAASTAATSNVFRPPGSAPFGNAAAVGAASTASFGTFGAQPMQGAPQFGGSLSPENAGSGSTLLGRRKPQAKHSRY